MTDQPNYQLPQLVHELGIGLIMLIEFLTGRVLEPKPFSADWKREAGDWLNQVTISAEMIAHYGAETRKG